MQPNYPVTELRQLIKDARWAIWSFVIINIFVLLFLFVDGIFNKFVFVALFVQVFLLIVWLLPVFFYQVFFKKVSVKYSFYKALASYKDALGYVPW
jgi:fatty acid desaturase